MTNNTPPHWTTRPKEAKELTRIQIVKRILVDDEPVYCGGCGERLQITGHGIGSAIQRCSTCNPDPAITGPIGALRIIDDKIVFDTFQGDYDNKKHLRFNENA